MSYRANTLISPPAHCDAICATKHVNLRLVNMTNRPPQQLSLVYSVKVSEAYMLAQSSNECRSHPGSLMGVVTCNHTQQ